MFVRPDQFEGGITALRQALALALSPQFAHPHLATAGAPTRLRDGVLWSEALDLAAVDVTGPQPEDQEFATSSEDTDEDRSRIIALVELARSGDTDAFGLLFDHYNKAVYRFIYYRVGSVSLAEDLTSETFFRALRSMSSFRWQGRDFGAWLITIARNLTTDHFKSARNRLEHTTEDMGVHDSATEGPELAVLASLTNEALLAALRKLPEEQQECVVMRFLQGMSIAETAEALCRSEGAVKQLQLRGVRNLAKLLPEGVR